MALHAYAGSLYFFGGDDGNSRLNDLYQFIIGTLMSAVCGAAWRVRARVRLYVTCHVALCDLRGAD
jgi:hypothetical protein